MDQSIHKITQEKISMPEETVVPKTEETDVPDTVEPVDTSTISNRYPELSPEPIDKRPIIDVHQLISLTE